MLILVLNKIPHLICLDLPDHESQLILSYTESHYLPGWFTVSFYLFLVGAGGMVFNYKNFLVTMMCAEIMYLGAVTGFVLYGLAFHDAVASIYALIILIFVACESAVGLGLLVAIYRFGRTIGFKTLTTLGG
jgi:NADH:ubiquinone oxidoreductase subunit K